MEILMEAKSKYEKKYKCPLCGQHYTRQDMIKHVEKNHEDELPEGYTPIHYVFDIVNKKDHGNCVICHKVTNWNPTLARYDRFCSIECKNKYTKEAKARMVKVYGKEHLLDDPDHQKKMIGNRGISGTYHFTSGGELSYTGSYEKKALEFMDRVLEYKVTDIETPGPVIPYMYKGVKHFWITDIFIPVYELCIDVKDGGEHPNNRDMKEYREKQIAKEKAIAEQGRYNYLRLTDNNFAQLLSMLAELKMQLWDNDPNKIIRINENMFAGIGAMMPMETRKNDVYICNYIMDNMFANVCISDDPYFENAFVITADGILKEAPIQKIIGSDRVKYKMYRYNTSNDNLFNELHSLAKNKTVNDKSLLELVFNKDMFSSDEWICYEGVEEINDIYTYLYETRKIVRASILSNEDKSMVSFTESDIDNNSDTVILKEDMNGYYLKNSITGMRTESRKDTNFSNEERQIVTGGIF